MAQGTLAWLERWSGALRGTTQANAGMPFAIILLEILLLGTLSTGKYYHLRSADYASLSALVWLPVPVKAVAGAVASKRCPDPTF